MENIGKVKIDYSSYKENKSYSKNPIEDDLLNIARNFSKVEYSKVIEQKASWPYLYHLSSMRENIVRWLPISKNDKVLEICGNYGEITGALCEMAGQVVSVDEEKNRCIINANRNSDKDNLTIIAGKLEHIDEKLSSDFDYVILNGVLELSAQIINSPNPYADMIRFAKYHLKAGGRIVIATDNRLGLKYFAGNKEPFTGKWFGGIEGETANVKLFTKTSLEKLLKEAGEDKYNFYYPYPDYRLMTTLFSDKRLPKKGELVNNDLNFDNDKMLLFDEALSFDQIIEDEVFDQYSNSLLVIIGDDTNTEYARFSNDRANEYAIETSIETTDTGKVVKKRALFKEGDKHILSMKDYQTALEERYLGSKLKVNRCSIEYVDERPVAVFEFLNGKTLGEIMSEVIDAGDNEIFMELFREYVSRIGYNEDASVTDKDIVFANIIVEDDTWTLIDYEWTVLKSIPTKEIAFRSIYCYLLEHKNGNKLNLDLILKELKLSQEAAEDIRYDEGRFQKQITGNRLSMGELRERIGHRRIDPIKLAKKDLDTEAFYKFQIYRSVEGAFSEASSFFYEDAYENANKAVVDIDLSADEKVIRLDPLMDSCLVIVKECTYNGTKFPVEDKKSLLVNGKRIDGNSFVFPTDDPNMEFVLERLPKLSMNKLHVELEIMRISSEAAGKIAANIKKLF